ncbi:MAG: CHC2 zinc finger domain-containing protein [Chloroflexota bacterium]
MSVTQQIKDRLDIVTYVQDHVPDLKKAGRYYKACCPFHGEKTPSFVVNPETQSWRCFGACAEGGDIFTFAQKMHGWDFSEALRELSNRAGVELKKRSPEQQAQDNPLSLSR